MKKQLVLDSGWQFKLDREFSNSFEIPEGAFPSDSWLPAHVPGTVHTDLLANGLLADPFYRDNERKAEWVEKAGWVYRTEFELPAELLAKQAVQLVAEGLDTIADIYVNGELVARTENMHVTYRFDIKDNLLVGKNELRIRFHSPTLHAKLLQATHGQPGDSQEPYRIYVRKAQYAFGWDWGPRLATSGIWRPIYIEGFGQARLTDVFVEPVLSESLDSAIIQVQIETEWFTDKPADLEARVEYDGREKMVPLRRQVESVSLDVANPGLWWPAGYGAQTLHGLRVTLLQDGREIDVCESRFALRKVELVQEPDEWGRSFYFRINNVPVFCKGANWIPADSFLPRVGEEKYGRLLRMARDANMNMIRVWGGGIYEQEVFYDLCDELGLLVWQDFMFACGGYPEHTEYTRNVAVEIEQVVKRLRNHPSIVLWCGNNENEWIWHDAHDGSYQNMPGLRLFHKLIPGIMSRLDPTRPYWPSSPFGGTDPNSENEGNRHQWNIWSNWADFTSVRDDRSRFVTEFGFQACANLKTLAEVTLPEDRQLQSEVMEFRNKQVEGQERLFRFLAGHMKMPDTFDDFVFKTQVLQGEALKTCLEHWRRKKFRTAGSLIWQLNDCWPVTSWSIIDSELRPKAAYYYVRRALRPLLVSFSQEGARIEIWVTNDTLDSYRASLRVEGLTFNGDSLFAEELEVEAPANASVKAHTLPEMEHFDASFCYLKAELRLGKNCVSENRFFGKHFKHLKLPTPVFETTISPGASGTATLRVGTTRFAKSVNIRIAGAAEVRDNFFDLDANAVKKIEVRLPGNKTLTENDVLITSL